MSEKVLKNVSWDQRRGKLTFVRFRAETNGLKDSVMEMVVLGFMTRSRTCF